MAEALRPEVAVIGGGPAGLMAAEVLSAGGARVTVYERMPSVGRKFLMAGRGGLNLTHSEPFEPFLARYGARADTLRPVLEAFPPAALVAWAEGLGQPTFVGSSGRVFPRAMKASPLLRAWLARLEAQGVRVVARRRWTGWDGPRLVFHDEQGREEHAEPAATILALGGASWARLGSDGAWAAPLAGRGAAVAPFQPANCGFNVAWSKHFRSRFAGAPLKNVALRFDGRSVRGEAVVTSYGLEGGAVYALAAPLRDAVLATGEARLDLDLRPDLDEARLAERVASTGRGQSMASVLRKAAGLSPVAANLLREAHGLQLPSNPAELAHRIKRAPIVLTGVQPLDRAISTAGGLAFEAVDADLLLRELPGVYAAGEMLDWEAPTGGYLLQASFATGAWAAQAALRRLGLAGASRT
ncbi:MAG TPA: TIGR03862 family flavoprotein [Caulobacteraceae bacterium]|jgi:hypothetical protein